MKKVLITGKAGLAVAVQALNEGVIDYFIRPQKDNIEANLNSAISKLSRRYFNDVCAIKNINLEKTAPYLFDLYFSDWFNSLCRENDIVEYYLKRKVLVSEFLLVNKAGDIVIPCFSGDCVYDASYKSSWEIYVYPAQKSNNYVYAPVDAKNLPESGVERVAYSLASQHLSRLYGIFLQMIGLRGKASQNNYVIITIATCSSGNIYHTPVKRYGDRCWFRLLPHSLAGKTATPCLMSARKK